MEPAFAWWAPYVLKKCNHILANIKSKYWIWTHKYGIKIPKNVNRAKEIDKFNQNNLWWDAIMKEMKNVQPDLNNEKEQPPILMQLIKRSYAT